MHEHEQAIITPAGLGSLIGKLRDQGFQVIGPTRRDDAIVYDEIEGIADLPAGWTDEQDGGHYRLKRRDDGAMFGYAVGPHSWKRYLHPPMLRLMRAERTADGMSITSASEPVPRYAFIAVRSCELHAIAIQDRVFLEGPYVDPHYQARREGAFIVAVNCGQAGGTCFCVSMNTGPKADAGYDIALTELLDGEHRFLAEPGSERGAELLAELARIAPPASRTAPAPTPWCARTAASMGRQMNTAGLRDLLMANLEHPRWDDVAERCLTCGNCTMVCPTCFCTTRRRTPPTSPAARNAARRWDSCFTIDFSYIHGGSIRASNALALSPVDDAQAGDLVRSVRHLGLRRLRPLHHLVPGRHRHHRGGARNPRRRRQRWKGLSVSSPSTGCSRDWATGSSNWRRAARRTCGSTTTSICFTPTIPPTGSIWSV